MPPDHTTRQSGASPAPPVPGTLLAGRFEVIRPYDEDHLLGRDAATLGNVVIAAAEAGFVSPAGAEVIARQVSELAGLPGIAAPLYAGRDGGWFILVSPLVHGVSLAERLGRGPLSLSATLRVACDLLQGLTGAHERDLLHLAVSPANVIVNADGPVRQATLAGFGAAALRGCLPGEPGPPDLRYAAPELTGVLDRPVDHRADIYSLGLVLHECLTGRPTYAAATDGELLRRRLTDAPGALRPQRPEVPADIEVEILRMLAVEPAGRPTRAADVIPTFSAAADVATAPRSARPVISRDAPGTSPLVGRDAELARLLVLVGAAADGRAPATFLEGSAGSGKTRLLDEVARRAAGQGAVVLRGAAREHPSSPANGLDGVVAGLLDLAARDPTCPGRLRAAVDPGAARALCALLPRLESLLGATARPPAHQGPVEPVRWAGAPALAALLAAAGSPDVPVLILLDDCQWTDQAVLHLIAGWGEALAPGTPHNVGLVAAYRPRGLPAEHPLRQLAAIGRIDLGRLGDRAITELVPADLAPDPAAERFVLAAAAGNPARAELAAGCLRETRGRPPAPPAPEAFVAWLLERLPPEVRKLLAGAALLGRDFSLDLAAAILGRGDTWTELARADAERRQLIVPSGADERRFAFTHDELRQALLQAIPAAERRRLHARACDVLIQTPGAQVYAAAHHAAGSGDPLRAIPRARAAARAATARQAPDVAEHYLREARRHAGDLAPEAGLEIVEELAAVHLVQGRTDLAAEQLVEAARLARDPVRQAAIRARLARIAATREDGVPPAEAESPPRSGRGPGSLAAVAGRTRAGRRRFGRGPRGERPEAPDARAGTAPDSVDPGGWAAAPSPATQERAFAPPAGDRPEPPRPPIAPPPPPAEPPGPRSPIDERLAALLVGGRGISAALSPEAIFTAVCDAALPLLRAERAVIVHLGGSVPAKPVISGYSPPCGESLARVCRALALRAAPAGQAVALAPGAADALGLDLTMIRESRVRAAICTPIMTDEVVTSCIYVDRSRLDEPFGPDEMRLAELIAGMAGTALENAAGFAKVESLSRSLEERVEERTAQLADSNRQLDLSLQRLTEAFERERASAAELKHQAFHDPLTDLANRALFVDRVEHALEVARRHELGMAVLFVDLDDFKTVNDSLGHPAGDELLIAVAARLREVLRRADTAARLGGDEFAILIEGSDQEGAVRAAERILDALEVPFRLAAKEVFVHASIGIAFRGTEEISVDALLRNADVAMYIAKSNGKRGFEVFEQRMHDEIVRRLELKDDLHRGIELRQFIVHYQPIVDIAASRIHGLEALIRWNHPVHGMISPLDFVPLAEETGMIRAIGDWVLRTACEATRGWQLEAGHEGERLTIGVNLSARELHEPGLIDCVAAALSGSGLAPEDLTLEITESVLMNDTEAAIARLRELKALGVRLAIDDFGTGYSSLSYLKHLPVDVVKIDKEFVDDIARGPQEAALAGAIVALSETLHLQTVAEGIEAPDQLRALRRLGCDFGQGYLFAKPMPAAETGALLRGDRRYPVVGDPGLRLLRAV